MSQSTESSPASGSASPASLHHQGSVIDFDGKKAQCAFGEYVKECDRPTAAFDIGIYNKVKKSQSVKGDGIFERGNSSRPQSPVCRGCDSGRLSFNFSSRTSTPSTSAIRRREPRAIGQERRCCP